MSSSSSPRRERLRELLLRRDLPAAPASSLSPDAAAERAPLSAAQQALWLLYRRDPQSAAYVRSVAFEVRGRLNEAALHRAFEEILRRHEVLRTVYGESGGEPFPRTLDEARVGFQSRDLSALPDEARAEALEEMLRQERSSPIALDTGPIVRVSLAKLSDVERVIAVSIHHIAFDGWSAAVMTRELGILYRAFDEGRAPMLAPPPLQYEDYARWQRARLSTPQGRADLEAWHARLDGAPALQLPFDAEDRTQTAGASRTATLSAAATDSLRALSRTRGVTPFMSLLTAFALLLSRYCGQDDVVIGGPVALRDRPELEELIGLFVNTLAFRIDLSGDPTAGELLDRVRRCALDAYERRDTPFERVVEALGAEQSAGQGLLRALISVQNPREARLAVSGASWKLLASEETANKLDLELVVAERERDIALGFVFSTGRFRPRTIERMLAELVELTERLVEAPSKRLSCFETLLPRDRERVLRDWNPTASPAAFASVPAMIERRTELSPQVVCIESGNAALTYAELETRTRRLARRLAAAGAGPGAVVAVCLERSPELIVALLAVWRARAAYVPLTPDIPSSRMRAVLTDSRASLLVASRALALSVERLPGLETVLVDDDLAEGHEQDQDVAPPAIDPAELAYILYTSGSTGKPKGVEISHGSLTSFLRAMHDAFEVRPSSRFLALTATTFDISILEMFLPLVHGARVAIASEEDAHDGAALARIIERHKVDILQATPASYRLLLDAGWEGRASLRVLCGGEPLPPALADALLRRCRELWNVYGPTEATVWATIERVRNGARYGIGRPLRNTRCYVLDRHGALAPIGAVGELFLGGEGVARGYRGRPAHTAERFVPDPFSESPGSRLYRTGDLVKQSDDGTLHYLGRADFQVKVRGFRVELEEIQSVLNERPEIAHAEIVARRAEDGSFTLAAYFTTRGGAVDVRALRRHLAEKLPSYMVPAAYAQLDSFPLTSSGKIDRKALPPAAGLADDAITERPASAEEEILLGIWRETLGLEQIGLEDNFFELGGHSLQAARVMTRVGELFGGEPPTRILFEAPTVARLASRVCERFTKRLPPIRPITREGFLALSPAQKRLWFLYRLDPSSSAYNVAMAVRWRGAMDVDKAVAALSAVIARHEPLRTTFRESSGGPLAQPHTSLAPELVQEDFRVFAPGECETRLLERAAELRALPFDLMRGPITRLAILRETNESSVVVFASHHIAVDGWSFDIVIREWVEAYRREAAEGADGLLVALPPIQYADYAVWQNELLDSEAMRASLVYWRRRLADARPPAWPRPSAGEDAAPGPAGGVASLRLDAELSGRVRLLSRRAGATSFMTLLTAYAVLIARYSGESDIVVGTDYANRPLRELEQLAGFFVNQLALRLRVPGTLSIRALLEQTRATVLEAFEHGGVPFDLVVQQIPRSGASAESPLFRVKLVHQNTPASRLDLGDLRLEPLALPLSEVTHDLVLTSVEAGGALALHLFHRTAALDTACAAELLERFRATLDFMTAHPDESVENIPVLVSRTARPQGVRGLSASDLDALALELQGRR